MVANFTLLYYRVVKAVVETAILFGGSYGELKRKDRISIDSPNRTSEVSNSTFTLAASLRPESLICPPIAKGTIEYIVLLRALAQKEM